MTYVRIVLGVIFCLLSAFELWKAQIKPWAVRVNPERKPTEQYKLEVRQQAVAMDGADHFIFGLLCLALAVVCFGYPLLLPPAETP